MGTALWNGSRRTAELVADIPAPAADAWALLNDWAGILRWWPANGPIDIVDVTLGGARDALPRSRHIRMANGTVGIETLLLADPIAMRIYYDLENGGIPVVRNYLASTTIDPIDAQRCRMTFSSRFDVLDEADAPFAEQIVGAVYAAIRDGFSAYFTRAVA